MFTCPLGVWDSCDMCEYSTTREETLQGHIDVTHKNIKYMCSQCDYSSVSMAN